MLSEDSYEPETAPGQSGVESIARDRSEFDSLVRRYRALTWSTSVKDQRERSGLQGPLMRLYLIVYPEARYHFADDFDVILRTLPKRPAPIPARLYARNGDGPSRAEPRRAEVAGSARDAELQETANLRIGRAGIQEKSLAI